MDSFQFFLGKKLGNKVKEVIYVGWRVLLFLAGYLLLSVWISLFVIAAILLAIYVYSMFF